MKQQKQTVSGKGTSFWNNNSLGRYLKQNYGILLALLALILLMSFASDVFLTKKNLINIFRQMSSYALLAFAISYCLIIGCIDLSVGANMAMAGIICAQMMTKFGFDFITAALVAVLAGMLCGFLNGFIVANTGMPPYIVTLAMQNACRGAAYLLAGGTGSAVKVNSDAFYQLGNGFLFGIIPIPVIIYLVLGLVLGIVLHYTVHGRHMYAIGGNKEAAMYVGVNIKKIQITTYVISGALAAMAGIITASRVYSGQPSAGDGYESNAIAAAVLGGTSFNGGRGTIEGTIIGVLVIQVITNGLNLLEVSTYWQWVAKGIVIMLAVYIDTMKQRRSGQLAA